MARRNHQPLSSLPAGRGLPARPPPLDLLISK